jgi:hypothetical protein
MTEPDGPGGRTLGKPSLLATELSSLRLMEGTMKVLVEKYWGISAISLAAILFLVGILFVKNPGSAGQFASNYFAAGEFARGVFASGEFAAGIFAAGTFAIGVFSAGVFSIGIFSIGIFSAGVFSVGLFVLAKYRKPLQIATPAGGSE